MRVGIDARYVGIRPSGIGRYCDALLNGLTELDGASHIEAWLHPRVVRERKAELLLQMGSLTYREVASTPNHLPTMWWPRRLAPLDHLDVFHAPFNILGRGHRTATVVTVHDLMWLLTPALCQRSRWKRAVQSRFFAAGIRRALFFADRVIVPSRATADAIHRLWPAASSRVTVIPHGVDPAVFRPAEPSSLRHLGLRRPYILAVGQHAPYKNHEAVERAFWASGLAKRAQLVLLQRGGRRLRRTNDSVLRLGAVAEADYVPLLQGARIVVQYSRCEGFGLPALEAMACARPLITSDDPALVELTGGTGPRGLGTAALVVPSRRPSRLAEALRRLWVDDNWRADLGALGRERSRSFRWPRSAALHHEVYRDAVHRRHRPRRLPFRFERAQPRVVAPPSPPYSDRAG